MYQYCSFGTELQVETQNLHMHTGAHKHTTPELY